MSDFDRKVGDTLGLRLALYPADDTKFVQAFLTDKNGGAVAVVPLPNVGAGIYLNNTVQMPQTLQVFARYVVYEDSGFTTVSCDYPGGSDVFDLDTGVTASSGANEDRISANFEANADLKANLETIELKAKLVSDEIGVSISENANLKATIRSSSLTANIKSQDVLADLD